VRPCARTTIAIKTSPQLLWYALVAVIWQLTCGGDAYQPGWAEASVLEIGMAGVVASNCHDASMVDRVTGAVGGQQSHFCQGTDISQRDRRDAATMTMRQRGARDTWQIAIKGFQDGVLCRIGRDEKRP
jgi:hypothetical protein